MRTGSRASAKRASSASIGKTVISAVLVFVMMLNGIPAQAIAEATSNAPVGTEQAKQPDAVQQPEDQSTANSQEEGSSVEATAPEPQPSEQLAAEPTPDDPAQEPSQPGNNDGTSVPQDTQRTDIAQDSKDVAAEDAPPAEKGDDEAMPTKPKEEPAPTAPAKDAKPAQSFADTATNGIKVCASVDEGVFPAGTTMEVSAVDGQTARLIGMQVVEEGQSVVSAQAVDISFYDLAHEELEPQDNKGVHIAIQLPGPMQGDDLVVVHQASNGTVQEVQDVKTNEAAGTAEFVGTEFSVYAVVETTKIVTFEFYESAEATKPVRTQVVVEGDYLYAPGAVSGANDQQLDGWYMGDESTQIDFDAQGRHVLTSDDINKADAGGKVRVNARYAQYYDVVFWSNTLGTGGNQTRNVFSQLRVRQNGTISAADLPSTTTLLEPGQILAGWAASEGSTTVALPANFSNVLVTAAANYYPVIKASHVIHFDANRMKGMQEDSANGVKKMTVSYTAPQVVAAGDKTVAPANPTAEGGAFTFEGWYEKDGNGNLKADPFAWGNELDSDITLYAKWTPGQATYHVNVWKEKVTVRYDDASRTSGTVNKNNYDFWTSYSYTAPALNDGDYTYVSVGDDVSGITTNIDNGFELRTRDQQKILLPDGTTEVNVYWNRKTQSVTFHEGSVVRKYKIPKDGKTVTERWFDSFDVATTYTGLYDQPFEMYGWSWPSGSIGVYDDDSDGVNEHREGAWRRDYIKYEDAHDDAEEERKGTVRGNDIRTRVRGYFNDSLRENYYFRVETPDPPALYNVRQSIDGTWPKSMDDSNVIAVLNDADNPYAVNDIYPHFTATGYSYETLVDEEARIPTKGGESIPNSNSATRFLYFSRNKFHVTLYKDSSATETVASNDEYFEAPLVKYGSNDYKLPNTDNKTFGGWYYAPGVTDPAMAIDWANLKMPANNIVVYPIWVPNSVNVRIDLGADDASMSNQQSLNFWANLGDTIDMTYLNAATRADHVLSGWYLPNNTSEAAWSEGQEIGANLCDMANGKVTKTEDPNYHNYYYTLTLRAKWAYARTAKVRYDLNGGTGDIPNSTESYLFGSKVKVTTQIPTPPAGMQFLAWQDAVEATDAQEGAHTASHVPGSTFAYDDEGMVTTEGGQDYIVLKALYVTRNAPTSTITYYPNYAGATSNPKVSESYEWGDQITLPNNTFTRDGYELAGWSDMPEVSTPGAKLFLAGSTVGVNAFGTTIDDATNRGNNNLYAVWRKVLTVESKSTTVTYNGKEQTVDLGFKNVDFTGDGGDHVRVTGLTSSAKGTNVGTYAGTVTGSAKVIGLDDGPDNDKDITERFKVESVPGTLAITPRDLSANEHKDEVTVTLADAGAYNGKQKKPAATVTVTIDGEAHTLVEGTDFTVAYANNINAAESTATSAPTATITFMGNYAGTASKTFSIAKATVTVTPKHAQSKVYGTDDPTLEYEAAGLVGSDTLLGTLGRTAGDNVGEYAYDVSGLSASDNYEVVLASDADKFAITRKQLTFTWPTTTTFEYDGNEKSITATAAGVKDGDEVTLAYTDNAKTNAGDYTAKVTALAGASAGNYYFESSEPTASQVWSITKATYEKPTATHTGATSKTATDGTVTVTPVAGTAAEYSTDGGATWNDVPEGGTIEGLPAGDVLVRTKGDDNHKPSDPVTQTVGYRLTGTIYWDYAYSTPTSSESLVPDQSARSKYARVTLRDGSQTPRTLNVMAEVKSASTAEGTYAFEDVPLNAPVSVSIVPTMTADATEKAANHTVTMRANNLDADVNFSAQCFDATWRVDVKGVGTVDGVVPDTVYVKVLFVGDETDKDDLNKYQVIVQQRDSDDGTIKRNGAACTLNEGTGDVVYTATGSYPVWTQKAEGGTYYHKAQVVGYTVNGTYIDCSNKGYVSEGAMTYDTSTSAQSPDPMVVTIDSLDVPVLEFNPNGEGATVATPYVLGSAYGSSVPAATITGNTATLTGYTFEGWYDSDAKNGGNKEEGSVTLNGKTTLYAHWSQNQDAPTGLTATKASTSSTTKATISRVNTNMEYSTNGGTSWEPVTDATITGISANTSVQVRYKAVEATSVAWPKNAGAPTTITIQAKATQDPPKLTATKATDDSETDAAVTVEDYDPATKPATYSTDGGNTWTAVPNDGVIGNLGAGTTVQVKYTETDDYEASEPAQATIEVKAQQTITPTIEAPSATTIKVTNPQAGVTYTLCDANRNPIAGADPITATASGDVVFEDCTPGTTYTVRPSIADDANTHYACTLSTPATTPKLNIVVGTAVPAAIERTYNGLAQTLVTALTGEQLPEGCTKVLYSIQYAEDVPWNADTANWTEDPSKGVNAQTYYTHVKYVGDDQHNDLVYDGRIEATIALKSLKDTDISALALPSTMMYSGTPQGPAVVVRNTNLGAILANGTDYTIEYGTATNVGDYSLIVRGTGNYKDAVDVNYHIAPYQVGADDKLVVDLGATEFTYNGAVQRPGDVKVVLNGTQLDEGVDYDLAYLDENGAPVASVNAGAYEARVTLKGNYAGETAAGYTIKPKQISDADVTSTPATLVYSGAEQGPAFSVATVLAEGQAAATLAKDTDYKLTGNTAVGAGTYTATVVGTGNYTGTVQRTYTIAPYKVGASDTLAITFQSGGEYVYNGASQTPSSMTVTLNGTQLVRGTDYDVSYLDKNGSVTLSKDAGAYQVKIELKGNYEGEASKGYTIKPKPLTSDDVALNKESFEYSGSPQGPEVTVTSVLVNGDQPKPLVATDYILSDATATDAGNYQVTVTGVGNYTGTVQKPYVITKASVGTPGDDNKPTAKQLVYNGEAQELVTPPATLPEGCAKIQYSTDSGTTWSDDVPTGTEAKAYPIKVRYVGDKNHNDLAGDTISPTVAKRSVTLIGRSATKVFNGREQSVVGVDDAGELKLVDGHTHNAAAEAKGTNVGEHAGTITTNTDVVIKDAQDSDVTSNYDITTTPGKLTITKAPLADSGKGDGLLANDEGKPITAGGTITGDLAKQVPLVTVTGTGNSTIYDGEDHVPVVKDAVTGNPLPAGTYTIAYYSPNDVENGKPKQNATPLTGDDVTKNVGERVAVVTFNDTGNYQPGSTIAVLASIQKRPVTLSGAIQSVEYDGQSHTASGVTVGGSGLVAGHTHNATFSATGTDRGAYDGTEANPATSITPKESVTIKNGNTDVTSNYDVTTVNGRLTIGAVTLRDGGDGKGYVGDTARVSVTFNYNDAVYDGGAHVPEAYDILKSNQKLTEGEDYVVDYYHQADIDSDGEPKEGATPLDATIAADDKVAIVTFTKDFTGSVKVNAPVSKRPVTLAGVSATRVYTGKEQSVSGVEDKGALKLVEGHTHNATAVAKGANAGVHTGTITAAADVVITNAQGTDITANYSVSTAPGTLTIAPVAVNDGKPTSKINPVGGGQDESNAKPVVNVTGSNPGDTSKGHSTPGTSSDESSPVYDGTEHGPSVTDPTGKPLAPGTDYDVTYYDPADVDSATGLPKDGSKPLDPTDAGQKVAVIAFKGNYAGVVNVPIKVSPRPLHVKTQSVNKGYDGTPLVATESAKVWIAGEAGVPEGSGLVDGQTVAVVATGSQTDAGSSANTYTLRFADAVGAESAGGLRAEAANGDAYDGIAKDGKPTAKSGNYVDQSEDSDMGTLTVSPAKLTVTTPSATKAYDGKALTSSKGAKIDGLASGETATVRCTGSQTKVGSSKNTYEIQWGTAAKDNYTVDKEDLGTLTVTKAETKTQTPSKASSSGALSRGTSTAGGSGVRSSLAKTADSTSYALLACVVVAAIALVSAAAIRRRQ